MMLYFMESLEVLVLALKVLHEEAKPLELKVSWAKTKVQSFEGLLDDTVQSVHASMWMSRPPKVSHTLIV